MGAIPYALSVTHFVDSVGAKAGFAAIIGLALLVLLFFAQMRETASLRDRAAESDEHVRQLEAHVAQLSRGYGATTSAPAVVPAPAGVARAPVTPAPAGIRTAASGAVAARAAAPPSAPAGVGAPALSSATHAIPSSDQNEISIRSNRELAAAAAAGAGVATAAATAGSGDGSASGAHGGGAAVATPPGPRPATAAGGANGSTGRQPAPIPAPAPPPPAMRLSNPAQRQQPRPGGARPAPPAAPRRPARAGSSRIRAGLMIAAGVAVLAIIVVVLLNATSGGTNSTSNSSVASSSASRTHHGATTKTPLKAADVSVTVLNGTQTTNLAHDITQRLAGSGFKTGTPATAPDQTLNATVVGYRSRANRSAALMVARSLKLGPASVQPVSQSNLAVACPQTSSCTAQVIVTIGADLAPAGGTTTAAGSTT